MAMITPQQVEAMIKADVNLHIGEPIQVTDYMNGSLKKGAKRLTADLTNKLQQLSHQESEISSRNFAEMSNS